MIWRRAIIFPDTTDDWAWTEKRIIGLPAGVRLLITLRRFGIEQVIVSDRTQCFQNTINKYVGKKDLPHLVWRNPHRPKSNYASTDALCVRGGVLFESELLHWFHQATNDACLEQACLREADGKPLMVSFFLKKADIAQINSAGLENLCSRKQCASFTVPPEIFSRTVAELTTAGNDRALLSMVEKVDEAGHVGWIRNRIFPAVRWFADVGVSPNQVSWGGFGVGILGAFLLAVAGYWGGVAGSLLLCLSWISDNIDGTLARLTFSESPLGETLDSVLGHLINLAFFIALVWSVYGKASLLKAGLFAAFIVGSIAVAHRLCQSERRLRTGYTEKRRHKKLQVFLDQINGRDFAVLIFLFALCDGFRWFLWGSAAGIQVFWMLHLWLLLKHRREDTQRQP